MSASPALHASHLRLVDEEGNVTEFSCPHCAGKEHELKELERKMRGLARELGELRRDKDAEARAHRAWPTAVALWEYWVELTGHTRAKWTTDRFWILLPQLRDFGAKNCAAAIAGIAYNPNEKLQRNGKMELYDDWATCFGSAGKVERYIKRRAAGWQLPESLAGKIANFEYHSS